MDKKTYTVEITEVRKRSLTIYRDCDIEESVVLKEIDELCNDGLVELDTETIITRDINLIKAVVEKYC